MPRPLKKPVGFLNPSTNPSKDARVFFKIPQVNLTCMLQCWISQPVLAFTGFKKNRPHIDGFLKPVIVRTGLKNPSMKVRIFLTCLADDRFIKPA